jgi:hypothetical protein
MDKIYGGSTLADSSKKMYTSKLRKIAGTKDLTNLNFLKDTDAVTKKIEALSLNPNSRRSSYIAIVTALKNKKPYKKVYDTYHAAMMGLNTQLNKEPHKDETTKKKQENVTMEELLSRQKALMSVLPEVKKKCDTAQFMRLHDLVVTSLYTLLPPRRNLDYSSMVVDAPSSTDKNYYHNGKFIFNLYKTKGAYQQQVIDVPSDLQEILKVWLKYKPKEDKHLLIHPDVSPPTAYTANEMTKVLKRAFNNPNMGVSVLRNVFLTTKFGAATKELKDDVAKMGTSVDVAQSTYIKA